MKFREFQWVALMAIALPLGAGCGSNVVARDCSVKCENAHNDCTKKCTEDTCKTQCDTDLNNCKLSCEKVSTTNDGG